MKLDSLRELSREVPIPPGKDQQQWFQERMRQLGMDPEDLYQELEMTSSLVDTHRDVSHTGDRMQLHSHSFYEVLYCVSSGGAEYLVGPERYRLQPGDVIFVPPGVSHRPLLPERMEGPYERYVLWLSEDFFRKFAQLLSVRPEGQDRVGLLRTGGTRWEGLGDRFEAGVQEAERQEPGWETMVLGNTMSLLALLRRAAEERTAGIPRVERPELVDALTAYVERHYPEPITVGDLARRFYVSESTVSHLFKQKLGVSLYRYVTQRRLIGAKTLIGEGLPLEEVAARTGFRDYSGFYRAFRKEYGISPRRYRALL